MIHEKTYFDRQVGHWRFSLRQKYLYTDHHSGKIHMNKCFTVKKINPNDKDAWYHDRFIFFTGWHRPRCIYTTAGHSDDRPCLEISLGLGWLYVYLPRKNKNNENKPVRKYGFYLYGEGRGLFDTLFYYKNRNGHTNICSVKMPWAYEFYRHSIYLKDGSWWTMLEKERRKAYKSENVSDESKFHLYDDSELIYKEEHPFKYVTKGGTTQETTATCFIEEREWRRKWTSWTRLGNHVKTNISISFADEMGNQRDTWKGGVLGVGAPMTREEKRLRDIESALRRYEEEVNRIHDYDR